MAEQTIKKRGRPRLVNPAEFAAAISEYLAETISEEGYRVYALTESDEDISRLVAAKLNMGKPEDETISLNKEYVRNFRRANGIFSAVKRGGGRPRVHIKGPDDGPYVLVKAPENSGCTNLYYNGGPGATEVLHNKCVITLSRMYGGGDRYLYSGTGVSSFGRSGKVGKGGGRQNISNARSIQGVHGY